MKKSANTAITSTVNIGIYATNVNHWELNLNQVLILANCAMKFSLTSKKLVRRASPNNNIRHVLTFLFCFIH